MDKGLVIDVMNPRGEIEIVYRKPAPRISDLKGKKIGLIDNKKAGARAFLNTIQNLLQREFAGIQFINLSKEFNEQFRMDKYMNQLGGVDGVIYSTGD